MRKYHKVWVANSGAGLKKRQFSVQLAFTPEEYKLRDAIVFRGTGKRISDDEINFYHKSVDVYWQQSVWTDISLSRLGKEHSFSSNERPTKLDLVLR